MIEYKPYTAGIVYVPKSTWELLTSVLKKKKITVTREYETWQILKPKKYWLDANKNNTATGTWLLMHAVLKGFDIGFKIIVKTWWWKSASESRTKQP